MSEFSSQLIQKAASGDQAAITELYELTYNSVYRTVKSMIADEDAVLDIVQDSYIKGFKNLDQLESPENFRAWMKRIATNKAKDHLKKKKPILFTDMESEDGTEIDFQEDRLDHCPEKVLDRNETSRLIREILDTLSDEQRLVIGMYYYEEMSIKEIAETLDCSENTVKSRLNYGRKKVEAKVKELEKKGVKLYSLAPLSFLRWIFRMDAEAGNISSSAILETAAESSANAGLTASGTAGTAAASNTAAAAGTAAKTAAAAGTAAKTAAAAGIKALTAKIAAGVLAVTLVGGGTMLALSSNDRNESASSQQTVSDQVSLPSEQEAYQGITDAYLEVADVDSTEFLNAPESYFNGDHVAIRYYHMYHAHSIHYAYYDIDKNGMDELLIGISFGQDVQPVDIYGFDGEQTVQLIDEPTLGDRSALSLLTDGTLYFIGGSGAENTSHEYYRVDGCTLKEVSPSFAAEVTDIPWCILGLSEHTAPQFSFDAILADIKSALTVSTQDYDSDQEHYDAAYSHLGDGVMWMLMHRELGNYTACIWSTEMDIDADGQDELCIGRGISPTQVFPIVIYKQTGDVIYGDAVYAYEDMFYGDVTVEWNYIGG